jgi:hypothetical protein
VAWVFWVSLLLTFMVNNVAYYEQHPHYLLAFPGFAIHQALDGLYAYLLVYPCEFLFSIYNPQAIAPRAWVYALMGIELVRPGILFGALARLPRPSTRPSPGARKRSWVNIAVLLLLLGVLAGVGWMRFQQGFLTRESAWAAGRYLARFCVLPLLIFALLWRLSGITKRGAIALPHGEDAGSSPRHW